jgi:hypothetical protein
MLGMLLFLWKGMSRVSVGVMGGFWRSGGSVIFLRRLGLVIIGIGISIGIGVDIMKNKYYCRCGAVATRLDGMLNRIDCECDRPRPWWLSVWTTFRGDYTFIRELIIREL